MIRPLSATILAIGLLAACARDTGGAGGQVPPAHPYLAGWMPLAHWGVGPIRAGTYFERPVIQALFPQAKVRDSFYQIAPDTTLSTIIVLQDGAQILEIDDGTTYAPGTDHPLIGKVRLTGGPVRGPRDERIGMGWREAGFDLSQCELGEARQINTLVCARRGEGAITYVFGVHGWESEVDFPPEPMLRAKGYLREIVWTPPPHLRPHAPTAPAPAPAPAGHP